MSSSSSGWVRVADGFRLVATAAARQLSEKGVTVASDATKHGSELLKNVRVAAAASSSSVVMNQQQQEHGVDNDNFNASEQPVHNHNHYQSRPTKTATTYTSIENMKEFGPGAAFIPKKEEAMETPSNSNRISILKEEIEATATSDDTTTMDKVNDAISAETDTPLSTINIIATDVTTDENSDIPPTSSSPPPPDFEEITRPRRLEEGSAVPATRISRAFNFAALGVRLATGTAFEATSRFLGTSQNNNATATTTDSTSPVVSDANADLLTQSLCRMRGAALKVGQMLSIQDESVLPPTLTRALEQVRQGATAMPRAQLEEQLHRELGHDWEKALGVSSFDPVPVAAASLGQVHRAVVWRNNQQQQQQQQQRVAIKVQYPGVADSIDSDLSNLNMLIKMTGFAPKGLFLDNVLRVARDELTLECDYGLERQNQERFRRLVESDHQLYHVDRFRVPAIVPELCTTRVLTSTYAPGGTIERVSRLTDQHERDRVAKAIMRLTMLELFRWRFMQTDPNWGNFLYDVGTKTTHLIDFGAAREYDEEFVKKYCRMIYAAAEKDREELLRQSYDMGFLTGDEDDVMIEAHVQAGFTIGEPFQNISSSSNTERKYDFGASQITRRIADASTPFLHHRLAPPPTEVYSLHRKIAGSYWLCIKLGANIECRDLLDEMMEDYNI